MRLDVRNMTQQQIADANNRYLEQMPQPFTGQPKLPMPSGMGAVGGMPLMPMLPMGVPPMGVPPMGFGPGVNNFGAAPGGGFGPGVNNFGAAPDVGNPMQDVFQRFLSAQGQGGTGMPSMGEPIGGRRPYGVSVSSPYNTDPSRPQPFGIAGGGTGMPPIGQPMDRQEYDDRDDAAYQARRSQYEQFMATQGGQPLAGRLGPQQEDFTISDGKFFPRPQQEDFTISDGKFFPRPQQEDFTISDGKFFPRPQQPQVAVNSGGYNPMTGVFTPSTTTPLMPPAGVTGMPPMGRDPFKPLIQLGPGMPSAGGTPPMTQPPMGGGLPYNNGFNNPGQTQQPMTQPAVGTPFNKPTGPQVQPPMAQPPAGGGLPSQPYNNGFYNPGQPPMAMKKGGFAVKAVWDKKRPKDLGKPKDLSAKKEKSAKARAKAAGRPYPNLIDNMAVARKKGK